MRPIRRPVLLLAALVAFGLAACDEGAPLVDAQEEVEVTVMTRNLYLGADLFVLLEAQNPEELVARAGQLYNTVLATDFPTRAGALADEIEAADPALIGLQEVSLYRVQAPSDFQQNPGPNAETVTFDFLAIFQDSLEARGLSYDVAATIENADVELPAAIRADSIIDVRLTDRDVILARSGSVDTDAAVTANYDAVLPVPVAGGQTISFVRGYAWVEAEIEGVSFVFANTHLEVGGGPDAPATAVQEAQAQALLDTLAGEGGPVVLVGDFNSAADGSTTGSYELLTGPYTDAYAQAGAGEGITCCHQPDLQNDTPFTEEEERIDLVLYRGDVSVLSTDVVGDEPGDRVGALWPSDHAGVVATLRISED